jgi:flagellar motor switch protein FliN
MQKSTGSKHSRPRAPLAPAEVEQLFGESARTPPPAPAEQVWTDPGVIERLFGQPGQPGQSGPAPAAAERPSAARQSAEVAPFQLPQFREEPKPPRSVRVDREAEAELDVQIELGHTRMHLADVLELRPGSVVLLDQLAGDPVELYVDGRRIARGEVVVLDGKFCIRVTELAAGGLGDG